MHVGSNNIERGAHLVLDGEAVLGGFHAHLLRG